MSSTEKVVHQAPPKPLPPAGDAQREELKQRGDQLEQKAEELAGEVDYHTLRRDAFDIRNEIAERFDYLQVTDARSEYIYKWVNYRTRNGLNIAAAQRDGWELVAGNDPECMPCKDELTRRRVGDVVLMKMRRDAHHELVTRQRLIRNMRERGIEGAIEELARDRGIVLHRFGDMDPALQGRIFKQQQAKQIARQQFGNMLRQGTVPGAPAPGVG